MDCRLFLGFIALTAVAAQQNPLVIVNGTLGGSVDFNLHDITLPQNYQLSWTTEGGTIVIGRISNNNNPSISPAYVNRTQLFQNGTLKLEQLTRNDEREYTATENSPDSFTAQVQNYRLNLYVPVTNVALEVNNTELLWPGRDSVSLDCSADGSNVSYSWRLNGAPLPEDQRYNQNINVLIISPVSPKDNGSFTCIASNPISNVTSNAVSFNLAAIVSDVRLQANSSELWAGASVLLQCSAQGTNVNFSWSLDGTEVTTKPPYLISNSPSNSDLTISPISRNDTGPFMCTATNLANSLNSTELYLKINSIVSDVTLRANTSGVLWAGVDSVLLQCSAQGTNVTFSWSLDGTKVISNPPYFISDSPSNSSLTISPISKKDTGPFICTATNMANSVNSNETSFDINWYPDGEIKCLSSSNNEYFTFVCAWENGHPPANVTMTFNGTTETKSNIVLKNVSLHADIQGSDLNCSGNQLGRTSTCTMTLEPPYSSGHNNDTVTEAKEGEYYVLRVTLGSKSTSRSTRTTVPLPATFVWYRYDPGKTEIKSGGKFIVNSTEHVSTLNITDVTPADAGKYECTATNLVGSQSFLFNLTVTTKANPPPNGKGLSGGAIAGIVIGVLAGLTLIGIIVYFILRKKKTHGDSSRLNNSDTGTDTVVYAEVKKANGGTAETTLTTNPSDTKDEVNYAAINFQNKAPTTSPTPTPVETVYSDVKHSIKT
ncbi:carcinoembryonic antigen-related cell adhesion molecule 1-like [Eleutherodactylus coqui]|uniref:carcinoembryonic antigen-related cell adhesion molecule 1-like n=1 Tax=Eleutherodactylus coqui TaxID=57060 RepID=UPI003462F590